MLRYPKSPKRRVPKKPVIFVAILTTGFVSQMCPDPHIQSLYNTVMWLFVQFYSD
jgi:hypothetical protein